MSLPTVVLNFDELADALVDYLKNGIVVNLGSVNVDTHTIEQLLQDIKDKVQGVDYSNLIAALNALGAKLDNFATQVGQNGISNIVGQAYDIGINESYSFEFNITFEGYITGITFSQSNQAYNSKDCINLKLVSSSGENQIFKTIYTKGFGEYKYLPVSRPVSVGDKLVLEYVNDSKNNKVLWVDYHCLMASHVASYTQPTTTPTTDTKTVTSDTASYLGRFVAKSGESDYVDPSSLELDYWTMAAESVPNNFWQGRNYLLNQLNNSSSDGSKYVNSQIATITNYHNYLYQMHVDIRKHNLNLTDWEYDYVKFIDKCNQAKDEGGYGLSVLTKIQQTQIYLTYIFQTVTLVFASCESKLTADYISRFKDHLSPDKLWVLEWIDFNDVNPDVSVGAFDLDLGDNGDIKTFRTYMNIEPSALDPATFDSSSDEILSPYFVKKYNSGDICGDSLFTSGFFPGVTWNSKNAPTTYYLKDNSLMAIRVFLHELGHGIDFQYGSINGTRLSNMSEWRNISGWGSGDASSLARIIPTKWASECTIEDTEPPISLYGCTLVYEAFAEAYSCYCLNPTYLKDFYPKQYGFMVKYVKDFKPYHVTA